MYPFCYMTMNYIFFLVFNSREPRKVRFLREVHSLLTWGLQFIDLLHEVYSSLTSWHTYRGSCAPVTLFIMKIGTYWGNSTLVANQSAVCSTVQLWTCGQSNHKLVYYVENDKKTFYLSMKSAISTILCLLYKCRYTKNINGHCPFLTYRPRKIFRVLSLTWIKEILHIPLCLTQSVYVFLPSLLCKMCIYVKNSTPILLSY